jgi:hypothetical protein
MIGKSEYKANLLIPGAGKSGTTSFHTYLNQHPKICMTSDQDKEPQYFAMDVQYNRGPAYYNSLFGCEGKKNPVYYGESSTTYLISEIAVTRIKNDLENPKFIILLRNPIDRMDSHYRWMCTYFGETKTFEDAVMADKDLIFDPNKPEEKGVYKFYYYESCYGTFIERYLNAFGKENIYILTTEDLKKDYKSALNNCFEFLGLDPFDVKETISGVTVKRHLYIPSVMKKFSFLLPDKYFRRLKNNVIERFYTRHEYMQGLTESQRVWIRDMLKEQVAKLKKLTGRDFKEWHDFN